MVYFYGMLVMYFYLKKSNKCTSIEYSVVNTGCKEWVVQKRDIMSIFLKALEKTLTVDIILTQESKRKLPYLLTIYDKQMY